MMQQEPQIQPKTNIQRALWVSLCVLLVLAMFGCASSRRKTRQQLKTQPKITSFTIVGNSKISDQEIFSRLQLGLPPKFSFAKRPRFDEIVFEADLQRIIALYRSRGYYDAVIIEHKTLPVGKEEVGVWVSLDEGKPILVERNEIRFAEGAEPPDEIRDLVLGVSPPFPKSALLKPGEVFNYDVYSRTREEIAARATNRGYAQANVRGVVQVDTLNHKAYIDYVVDPGPVCFFGEVKFIGLKPAQEGDRRTIEEEDLIKYLAFSRGEPFTRPKLLATQENLFDTGAFSAVNVEPNFVEGQKEVEILVSVEQVKRHRVQAGGGVEVDANSRFNLRGKLAWLDRSVSGGMSKLQGAASGGVALTVVKTEIPALALGQPAVDVNGDPVIADTTISLQPTPLLNFTSAFSLPYVMSPRRSFGATAGLFFDVPSGNLGTATIPLHVEIDRDLLGEKKDHDIKKGIFDDPSKLNTKAFSYGYGYTLQFVGVCFLVQKDGQLCNQDNSSSSQGLDAAQQALGLGDKDFFLLGYLEQHVTYNRTDDPADPKKGYTLSFNVHEGSVALGGQFNYLRMLPEVRGYYPLNHKKSIVLASRFQLGALLLVDERKNPSPFPERFFLGGANSHRGFAFQDLSPKQEFDEKPEKDNNPLTQIAVGGNGMMLSSTELRLSTPFGLRLVTFLDVGVVPVFASDLLGLSLDSRGGITDATIRTATGLGVRYVYGPLVFRGDAAVLVEDFEEINNVLGFDQKGNIFQFTKFQISIGEAF